MARDPSKGVLEECVTTPPVTMDSVPDITANIRTLKSEQPQLTAREIHAAIEAKHGEGTLTLAETKKWCAKITKQKITNG